MTDHRAADAASQAAEALRLLNHLTAPASARRALAGPADAYQIVGTLTDVPSRLAQGLHQIASWLAYQQSAGLLDPTSHGGDPRTAVTAATWDLDVAADSLNTAHEALRDVHVALGDLRAVLPTGSVFAEDLLDANPAEPNLEQSNQQGRQL